MAGSGRRIVRIVVAGRVQGVGFRAFVVREARRLDLNGWVRNRGDRAVEIVASGPAAAIDELAAAARRGPIAARVDAFRLEEAGEAALAEAGGEQGFVEAPTV